MDATIGFGSEHRDGDERAGDEVCEGVWGANRGGERVKGNVAVMQSSLKPGQEHFVEDPFIIEVQARDSHCLPPLLTV